MALGVRLMETVLSFRGAAQTEVLLAWIRHTVQNEKGLRVPFFSRQKQVQTQVCLFLFFFFCKMKCSQKAEPRAIKTKGLGTTPWDQGWPPSRKPLFPHLGALTTCAELGFRTAEDSESWLPPPTMALALSQHRGGVHGADDLCLGPGSSVKWAHV